MDCSKTTKEVFEEWGSDHRAESMEIEHRSVVEQAFNLIPESSGNYLEIGIGNGYGIHRMATNQFSKGHCYGIDLASKMVELGKQRTSFQKNVTIEQADFLNWQPPAEEPFSVIFSMEVFYYFPSIQLGINKAYSLLKPGGQLWILVDFFKENTSTHCWPKELDTPMQLWSKDQYLNGLSEAGFTSIKQRIFSDPGSTVSPDGETLCSVGYKV